MYVKLRYVNFYEKCFNSVRVVVNNCYVGKSFVPSLACEKGNYVNIKNKIKINCNPQLIYILHPTKLPKSKPPTK